MKNTIAFILFFAAFAVSTYAESSFYHSAGDSVYLILDEPYANSLPKNFRKCSGELFRDHKETPDTAGLSSLNISGSSEVSNLNIPLIQGTINNRHLVIIDLRQETHGFVNGMPVSWYGKYDWANLDLTRDQVIGGEKGKLDSLLKIGNITILRIVKKDKSTNAITDVEKIPADVKTVQTEEELTKSFDAGYFRLTVSDHRRPVNADVDRFVKYVQSLSGDDWIHFHCHAGDGRTTSFMVMYDMMKNAKKVSMEDIINRQYLLGGIDLSKDEDFPDFDRQYAFERTDFLKNFYEYCKTNTDGFKTLYTEWLRR
jgi:hypothetical protein